MSGPSISFDRVADRYDETRGGTARGYEFAADVQPWLGDRTVLEIGVGTGVVACALNEAGTSVVGLDISLPMARQAHERIGSRVALGDAQNLPVGDARVAAVLFSMVLHLVGDMRAAIAEAARVLRPGGRLVAVHGVPRTTLTDLDGPLASLTDFRSHRQDDGDALVGATEAAGLSVVHQGRTTERPLARSPNAVASEIETKVWSYLWRLDDAAWREQAVPAVWGAAYAAGTRPSAQLHPGSSPQRVRPIAARTSSATSSGVRPSVTTMTVETSS